MTIRALSTVFEDLLPHLSGETITIAKILEAFHERGFGVLLLLFAVPMAFPLPVPPGVNIVLASPLLLLTAQQALGRHTVWLPQKIKQKSLSSDKLRGMITNAVPFLKKIERLSRPRLGFITRGVFSNFIGVAGLIMALCVCIPVPLTNTVPSFGIALMAAGVMMRDGLAVLAGIIVGLLWVGALTYFAITFGADGIDMMKNMIKSII